jgi:hypothetical protein
MSPNNLLGAILDFGIGALHVGKVAQGGLKMRQAWCKKLSAATAAVLMSMMVTSSSAGAQLLAESRVDIQNLFTASGWMGDGQSGTKYLNFEGASRENPHSPPTCIKITYRFGPARWAGIYWQNKPDNWGDKSGENYSKKGFSMVTFWARGETGTEIVEFKAGGIVNAAKSFHDSFEVTLGRVALTKEWKQYRIGLSGADLSSVIGGFCWVANADSNSAKKITFFLNDIFLE